MTLDELIARAVELRDIHGGDLLVGCWPNDGHPLRKWHIVGDKELNVEVGQVVIRWDGHDLRSESMKYAFLS